MNSTDEKSKMKTFFHRYSRRTLFLKLCASFLFVSVVFCLLISPEKLIDTSLKFKQWKIRQLIMNPSSQSSKSFPERKRHLILLWTSYFSQSDWLPSTKQLQCPVDNCDITSDHLQLNHSSAVILHWRNIDSNNLPKCHFQKQNSSRCPLMVLFNKEAPPHTSSENLREMDDKIHWTATYRRDSDIKAPYGKVSLLDDVIEMPEINLNRSSVCWLVSNCHTSSQREIYVKDLNNSIPVEVYGQCGNHICPYEKTKDCYKFLSNNCRFYLSLENSKCRDYSTEKLYYAMMSNMLPIVLGGDDYAKHLPPHSFIDVKDYSSPKELANYLEELMMNDDKYLSYFQWRRKYLVQDAAYMWLCELCEKLNTVELSEIKPHKSFIDWWYKYPCL